MRIGALFAGYGGLDLAVREVLDAELTWVSEIERGACRVLAHRFPGVPNIGDITTVDWSAVEPVEVLTGGSPCQDLSTAGRRAGMSAGTRSNLWIAMRDAIAVLRPRLVVWENVRGAYSASADSAMEREPRRLGDDPDRPVLRALGRVLGDLADLGYDARWHGLCASDVGAPHERLRVFLIAHPADTGGRPLPRPAVRDDGLSITREHSVPSLLPTPTASDWKDGGEVEAVPVNSHLGRAVWPRREWGRYADAIARWESLTRPAPPPTETAPSGSPRLSARFAEWMMGLPDGWVTDVPGITRNAALRILGNGVCPPQAAAALRTLLSLRIEGIAS